VGRYHYRLLPLLLLDVREAFVALRLRVAQAFSAAARPFADGRFVDEDFFAVLVFFVVMMISLIGCSKVRLSAKSSSADNRSHRRAFVLQCPRDVVECLVTIHVNIGIGEVGVEDVKTISTTCMEP